MTATSDPYTQEYVDAILRRGVVFSILWLMGLGSAIAVYSGLMARRVIRRSPTPLRSGGRVWWCLITGAIGLLVWIPIVAVGLYNRL